MPEQIFPTIPGCDFHGCSEERKVLVVAREMHALPRFSIVSPVVPKSPLAEGSPEAFEVMKAKTPQVFWSTRYVPFYQTGTTCITFAILTFPKEISWREPGFVRMKSSVARAIF
jgi:hypothetical protein